eukprot:scaffold176832_cov35-Tisochrysis_lutea.AAC.5
MDASHHARDVRGGRPQAASSSSCTLWDLGAVTSRHRCATIRAGFDHRPILVPTSRIPLRNFSIPAFIIVHTQRSSNLYVSGKAENT